MDHSNNEAHPTGRAKVLSSKLVHTLTSAQFPEMLLTFPSRLVFYDFNLRPSSPQFQIESLYKKCHANIRADPTSGKKTEKKVTKKRWNKAKQTLQQRKDYVSKRKSDYLAKLAAESEA